MKVDNKTLLDLVMGATMTQTALCRFLIEEKVIDRGRLVAFLEARGKSWGKTASDEALLPLVILKMAVEPDEETAFPATFH
jgi:hypothetical protein